MRSIQNETYQIIFEAGSCGSFITSLVSQFVYGYFPIYGKFGDSHESANNEEIFDTYKLREDFYTTNNANLLDFIIVLNSNPIIIREHCPANINKQLKRFPKLKHIVITAEEHDLRHMLVMRFIKTVLASHTWSQVHKQIWNDLCDVHPFLKKYSSAEDISANELESIINDVYNVKLEKYFTSSNPLFKEYPEFCFEIKFSDIFNNPEKVLNVLSTVTNRPITSAIRKSYNKYLKLNNKVKKRYYPWIKHKQ